MFWSALESDFLIKLSNHLKLIALKNPINYEK